MYFEDVRKTNKLAGHMVASWKRARLEAVGLYDAYKSPSTRKASIYYSWQEYAREHASNVFSITGHNCMFFSLVFDFIGDDGKAYIAYITPSHNYRLEASSWLAVYSV